jgi:phospholipid-transporting ATPase
VQSSNLNEELGQVEYVFSDKTGTLTCNIMEFKKMSIGGISYGEVKRGQGNYLEDISPYPKVTNVDFRDKQLFEALNDPSQPEHPAVIKAMFLLALCHTIITEKQEHELVYNASSPDELALINFAKFVGVQFLGMDECNNMEVKFKNQVFRYQLLHVLEFNSTRKRMSVILRDEKGHHILYTKGADSIILDRTDRANS